MPVYVKLFRMHATDPGAATVLAWIGTVSQVKRTDPATAEVTCSTLAQSFESNGLRLSWGRICPYVLYDAATCKVDPATYAVTGLITDKDGISIHVAEAAGFANGYFSGGYVEWTLATDTYERRPIQSHAGTVLTFLGVTDGLEIGDSVTFYPGCDRTIQTCHDKFSNSDNSGACPTLPGVSPFDGRLVF
jgi:uncharacterized phage protein (TIGR02218 family)